MAIEKKTDLVSGVDARLNRFTDSAVHAALTVSTGPLGGSCRLDKVAVHYSAPVIGDVTVTLDSGAGAVWDTLLRTISLAAAQNGVWIPDEEILFSADDAIVVVAPDGGVGVTGAVSVYMVERGR